MITVEQFMRRVKKTGTCWLWIGGTNGRYGMLKTGGKNMLTHVVSYQLFVGPTQGLKVLHDCDVPSCVNPRHLFLGTQSDNMKDAVKKGRVPTGPNHWAAKLTSTQIVEIRARHRRGVGRYSRGNSLELAEEFGISRQHLGRLVKGAT